MGHWNDFLAGIPEGLQYTAGQMHSLLSHNAKKGLWLFTNYFVKKRLRKTSASAGS